MSNYIFAFHGGKKPESPEEGAKFMERWKAWVGGLGYAVVNPGKSREGIAGNESIITRRASPRALTFRCY